MSNYNMSDIDRRMDKMLTIQENTQAQMNALNGIIRGVSTKIEAIESTVVDIGGRLGRLENDEEIKTKQAKQIKALVQKVVSRRLGINEDATKRSLEEKIIDQKYRSMFSSSLYSEVSDKGHLASPYSTTAKKDFIQACKDIEEWYPREGVDGLKKRADEKALARKIAKEQGY